MTDRTRFEPRLSKRELEHLRRVADDIGLGRMNSERVLDELERCYQAILSPGYGFEAELDRLLTEIERLQEVCNSYMDQFIDGAPE